MNSEEPYREQAERLKQRIQKINDTTKVDDHLPPREQLHRRKKKKMKWKLKYPVIRLLVLFFVLLPVIIFSAISYLDGKKMNHVEKTNVSPVGYETINLDHSGDEDEINQEEQPDEPDVQEKDDLEKSDDKAVKQEQQKVEGTTRMNEVSPASQKPASIVNEPEKNITKRAESDTTKQQAVPKKETRIIYHKVQPKETLYRIAMTYYHSPKGMATIKEANHMSSDQVNAGQVLKIPVNN
ncbi:LysM peptidoglycan-binding domain-containing protein [Neobacillus mesonae]|nr:LysM peptidoglycan-binding domain-containing protein [Neobacillus mesonae]